MSDVHPDTNHDDVAARIRAAVGHATEGALDGDDVTPFVGASPCEDCDCGGLAPAAGERHPDPGVVTPAIPGTAARKHRSPLPTLAAWKPHAPRPDLWVSWRPNGAGLQKPDHFAEMRRTIGDNRGRLKHAYDILSKGVCDGCALGVAGFHDWTLDGIHLCTTRLDLLKVNTAPAMAPDALTDVDAVRSMSSRQLRELGRLGHPLRRRAGEAGFTRISWDEALDTIADRIRESRRREGDRLGFFLTSRGIGNETYYVAQKVARYLGTNSVDNAARICHSPSTGALKETLGVGATTVSYSDVIDHADLVVLIGSNVANNQPVFAKYLYLAKQRGAEVAVVNPYREPALEAYWVPSNLESAAFGTRLTDHFFGVTTGGDTAFLTAVCKVLHDRGMIDRGFVDAHTRGYDDLVAELESHTLADLARWAGSTPDDVTRFAEVYAGARNVVLVWSMGITQHVHGTDNVRAIVNLALTRGNVGRPGAGLMPIRGHSGVQGGAEMGAYATALPGGIPITAESASALTVRYGFTVGSKRGRSATEMLEAAAAGELDVLWSSGGNFLETLPDPDQVADALRNVPLRVHVDIVASPQMLLDGEDVIVLPAMTRYESPGGVTETTTERRIVFSPEVPGPRPPEVRAETDIYLEVARRVDPHRAHLLGCQDAQAIRDEIAQVVPMYAGIERLRDTGDQVQYGGTRLCDGWTFPTDDGHAHFVPVTPVEATLPAGQLRLSTRRGKQFNSMVWRDQADPITGAPRDGLLMGAADAQRLGLADGQAVTVSSDRGSVPATVHLADLRDGNVQMFFPEANPLLDPTRRDPVGLVPDYNATVTVAPRV